MDPQLAAYLQMLAQSQSPSAGEIAGWGSQRRGLDTQYGISTAQHDYTRGGLLAQQSQDTGDLAMKYDRMRESIPGGFAHRGLLNSGVYGGALQQYGQDRTSAYARMAQGYGQQLGQVTLDQGASDRTYTSGLSSVADAEAARRQDLATQIRGL